MKVSITLQSSMMTGAAYDADRQALDIHFIDGRSYTYEGVPQNVFEGLRDASSPGQFFHRNIKDQYA